MLAVGGVEVELPIERMTYDEAMLRYGTDRPDRRLGMEIHELGHVFARSEFKVFSGALADGGVVRGLRARGGEFPRSRMDALTEQAQGLGAKGLVWAVRRGRRLALPDRQVPVGRRDGPRRRDARAPRRATRSSSWPTRRRWPPGCSASCGSSWPSGAPEGHDLVWVTDFPMFGWNEDEQRWDAAAPSLHRARRATSTATPAVGAAAPTTW